jgi:hypothetical protein
MEQVYLQFSDEATRDKWFDILKGKVCTAPTVATSGWAA